MQLCCGPWHINMAQDTMYALTAQFSQADQTAFYSMNI